MTDIIQIGDLKLEVTRKNIKNVHLSVNPPDGQIKLSAPKDTRLDVVRAYVLSKLTWIRHQREHILNQKRETPREYVSRESHYIWGKRYLMQVETTTKKQHVVKSHQYIQLYVRKDTNREQRAQVYYEWAKEIFKIYLDKIIPEWEEKIGVKTNAYFIQKMKTKWGSCNPKSKNIRLNTELVKKPKHLVEYVVVHELIHLIEPTHNKKFINLMDKYYPTWRDARKELNELPLGFVEW